MNEGQQARIQDSIQHHQSPNIPIPSPRQPNQPQMHCRQAQKGEMDSEHETWIDARFEYGTDNVPED